MNDTVPSRRLQLQQCRLQILGPANHFCLVAFAVWRYAIDTPSGQHHPAGSQNVAFIRNEDAAAVTFDAADAGPEDFHATGLRLFMRGGKDAANLFRD